MGTALDELFTKLGFDRKKVWRISVIFWIVYIGSCILAVYLSSWGLRSYIVFGLYAYMMLIALPLLFSPAFWLVAGGLFAIAGQFGREQGLSLKDAFEAVKEYGKPILNKAGYVILVAFPVWFIAMILIDTNGIEQWFLFGLPLLPTTIYLVVKRWPDGETFNTVVRNTLLGIVIGIVALGAWNTVNRVTVDPAVQEMQAYHDKQASNLKKDQQELVQLLINKVNETGVASLTPKQLKEWHYFEEQRAKQTPAGRATTLATQVVTDVANAKPKDPSWWQAHWYLPVLGVGVIIALAILYRLFVRTAGGPDTGAHASAETPAKKGVSLWGIACLAFLGWCAFSYATATGWPGEYIANYGYTHQTKLYLKNLSDQKVCDQGLQPGTWHVSFPREIYLAHPSQNGRYDKFGGFYLLHKGEMLRKSFLEDVWVNGVRTGWNERVTVGPDHCFTVTVNISPEVKAEAVMYGNPQCWSEHQQSCQASGVPRTAEVNLMFSQKAPIR